MLEGKGKFSSWKFLCKKKKAYIKMLNNKEVKARILGGKPLWAAQKAAFFFSVKLTIK